MKSYLCGNTSKTFFYFCITKKKIKRRIVPNLEYDTMRLILTTMLNFFIEKYLNSLQNSAIICIIYLELLSNLKKYLNNFKQLCYLKFN